MNNVVAFINRPYDEPRGAVFTGGSDPSKVGKIRYFVDYVDGEGARPGVWDGLSYVAACAALAEWAQDGGRAVDLLREGL